MFYLADDADILIRADVFAAVRMVALDMPAAFYGFSGSVSISTWSRGAV